MSTPQQAFATAVQHHQAGRLGEAEALYRQVLTAVPQHADAIHLLGVIAHQVGRHDLAAQHITAAINLRNNNPEMHCNLGSVQTALGRLSEAADSYGRALRLRPDFASAHYGLGNVLVQQQRIKEGVERLREDLPSR